MECIKLKVSLFFWIFVTSNVKVSIETEEIDTGVLISVLPHIVYAVRSSPLTLECPVKPNQNYQGHFSYSWQKDGVVLENNRQFRLLASGSLNFQNVKNRRRKHFEGLYECLVSNKFGRFIGRRVRVVFLRMSKVFSQQPQDVNVTQGGAVRLSCQINATTDVKYIWLKDEKTFTVIPSKIEILPSGVLHIYNAQPQDEGIYKCFARNNVPQYPFFRHSHPAQVRVFPVETEHDPLKRAPRILSPPQVVKGVVGQPAVLECIVDGGPKTTVTWEKTSGGETGVLKEQDLGDNNYYIQSLVPSQHEGNYSCLVQSAFGTDRRNISLVIKEPPKIAMAPESRQFAQGFRVRLECHFHGRPPPHITWYKDGKILQENGFVEKIKPSRVMIESRLTDSGYYQCMGENSLGIAIATIRLNITANKHAPQPPHDVMAFAITPNKVRVTFSPSVAPSCCPVHSYVVNYQEVDQDYVHPIGKEVVQQTQVDIERLIPATMYQFFVVAYSKEGGASNQSNIVRITTKEGVPKVAPSIKLSSPSGTEILVSWTALTPGESLGTIVAHKVFYKTDYPGREMIATAPGNTTRFIITGLIPLTKYFVRVLAGTKEGYPILTSSNWPWEVIKTLSLPPASTDSSELTVTAINKTAIKLNWSLTNLSLPVSGYQLSVTRLLESGPVNTIHVNSSVNSYVLSELKPETFFEVVFEVKSEGNFTVTRTTKEFQTHDPSNLPLPPPPTELKSSLVTDSLISVVWNRPYTSQKIVFYVVQYSKTFHPYSDLESKFTNSTTLKAVLSNLEPYTSYSVAVRSHTPENHGPFSPAVITQTKESVPSEPQFFECELIDDNTLRLTWQPPKLKNGIITSYIIAYSVKHHRQMVTTNGTQLSTVLPLPEGTYSFELRASTSAGPGRPSPMLQVTVRACEPHCRKKEAQTESDGQKIGIIIGCCVGGVSIIVCVIIVCRQRHLNQRNQRMERGRHYFHGTSNQPSPCFRARKSGHDRTDNQMSLLPVNPQQTNGGHISIPQKCPIIYICEGYGASKGLKAILAEPLSEGNPLGNPPLEAAAHLLSNNGDHTGRSTLEPEEERELLMDYQSSVGNSAVKHLGSPWEKKTDKNKAKDRAAKGRKWKEKVNEENNQKGKLHSASLGDEAMSGSVEKEETLGTHLASNSDDTGVKESDDNTSCQSESKIESETSGVFVPIVDTVNGNQAKYVLIGEELLGSDSDISSKRKNYIMEKIRDNKLSGNKISESKNLLAKENPNSMGEEKENLRDTSIKNGISQNSHQIEKVC